MLEQFQSKVKRLQSRTTKLEESLSLISVAGSIGWDGAIAEEQSCVIE